MLKGTDDDDDDDLFFAPAKSTNLSTILQTTVSFSDEDLNNTSLKYSAPRQPSKLSKNATNTTSSSSSKVPSKIVFVKMVYGYKYVNELYEPLGKVGLAFIEISDAFSIILYKDPSKHIFNIPLTSKIHFILQENKYLTFYDESKQNWSILFENDEDLQEFSVKLKSTDAKYTVKEIPTVEVNSEQSLKSELLSNVFLQNDSDCQETASKADILSRMARMGQPLVFPAIVKSENSDYTDSDLESCAERKCRRPKPRESKSNEIVKFEPPESSQVASFNQLINDSRLHNTELKLNLATLENKIDKVYERLKSEQELELSRKIMELQFENEKLKFEMQRKQFEEQTKVSVSELDFSKSKAMFENTKSEISTFKTKQLDTIKDLENLLKQNQSQRESIEKLKTYLDLEPLLTETTNNMGDEINKCIEETELITTHLEELIKSVRQLTNELSLEIQQMEDIEQFFIDLEQKSELPETSKQSKMELCALMKQKIKDYDEHYKASKRIETQLEEAISSVKDEIIQVIGSKIDFEFTISGEVNKNNWCKGSSNEIVLSINDSHTKVYFDKLNEQQEKISKIKEFYKNLESAALEQRASAKTLNTTPNAEIDATSTDGDTSVNVIETRSVATETSDGTISSDQSFEKDKLEQTSYNSCISDCFRQEAVSKVHDYVTEESDEVRDLKIKVANLEDKIKVINNFNEESKERFKTVLAPVIKEHMNELYSYLEEKIKEDSKNEVTSVIIQTTYKILKTLESQSSLSVKND